MVRYTPGFKKKILQSIENGSSSIEQMCQYHEISEDEINSWIQQFQRHGVLGLRVTKRKKQFA